MSSIAKKWVESKHKEVIIGHFLFAVLYILGIFMPYVQLNTAYGSVKYSIAGGNLGSNLSWVMIVFMVTGLGSLLFTLLYKTPGVIVLSFVELIIVVAWAVYYEMSLKEVLGGELTMLLSYGIGYHFLWIGAVGMLFFGFYGLKNPFITKDKKSDEYLEAVEIVCERCAENKIKDEKACNECPIRKNIEMSNNEEP